MARLNGDGPQGPKRTKAQREVDKLRMIQMIAQRKSFREIGAALNLTHVQVIYDYKKALVEIKKQQALLTDLEMARPVALNSLEQIQSEAWGEWDRSKTVHEKQVTVEEPREQCPKCTGDGHLPDRKNPGQNVVCWKCNGKGEIGGVVSITKTVEGRLGDPRYLQLVGQALKMELELRGVYDQDGAIKDAVSMGQLPWDQVVRKAVVEVREGRDEIEDAIATAGRPALPAPETVDAEVEERQR